MRKVQPIPYVQIKNIEYNVKPNAIKGILLEYIVAPSSLLPISIRKHYIVPMLN